MFVAFLKLSEEKFSEFLPVKACGIDMGSQVSNGFADVVFPLQVKVVVVGWITEEAFVELTAVCVFICQSVKKQDRGDW